MDKKFAIFDMDGTLIDSMVYWQRLASEYLFSRGVEVNDVFVIGGFKFSKRRLLLCRIKLVYVVRLRACRTNGTLCNFLF